jgi:phenylpropionate dioxygenase-like ring-hydroxylating dioxygenase large terminal subunit
VQRHVQKRLIAEIDHYLDTATTAMADGLFANPVAEYIDPARIDQERAALFRRYPLVVGHSSECPHPNDFFTRDVAGVPVVVSRQPDGSLRAFLNVCRHRGSRVVPDDCGHRGSFTCPYHAWGYRADGTLATIPYEDGFADLDRTQMGLVSLPVQERHGLVWVVLAPGAPIDVAAHLGELDDELGTYGLDGFVVERSTLLPAPLNWKLVVDGFLEVYHLRFLHAATIAPYIKTNVAPFEPIGPHGRMVAVRTSYDAARAERPDEDFDLLPQVAVIYQVFPNTILIWQADHFESWLVSPSADDPARSTSRVQLLAPRPTTTDDEQRHWDRNWKVLMDTVLEEDFVVSESIQQGFKAGAQTHVTFGRNEPALQHFHRTLAAVLDPSPATVTPVGIG